MPCEFGVPGAERTILLYGDSHAVQWFEPLERDRPAARLRLVLLAKGGCPVTDVVVPTPVLRHTCPPYRDAAIAWIETNQPALVVVSNSYNHSEHDAASWAAGAEATMARLVGRRPSPRRDRRQPVEPRRPAGVPVRPPRRRIGLRDAARRRRSPERISGEVAAARAHGVTFVDTTDWFCTPTSCPAVIGDLLVLRDETHLTPPMAEFLAPLLDAALAPVLTAAG